MTSAINDLSIYGIFYGNYPQLVSVLEHAKDHVKEELKLSKERLETLYYPKEDQGAEGGAPGCQAAGRARRGVGTEIGYKER